MAKEGCSIKCHKKFDRMGKKNDTNKRSVFPERQWASCGI